MSQTPAQQFISQLDDYIDARIEKGVLPFHRMRPPVLETEKARLNEVCETLKADLETSLASLMRDAKRPGI